MNQNCILNKHKIKKKQLQELDSIEMRPHEKHQHANIKSQNRFTQFKVLGNKHKKIQLN